MTRINRRIVRHSFFRWVIVLLLLFSTIGIGSGLPFFAPSPFASFAVYAQEEVIYIPETGHTLRGAFLHFWRSNGGPLGNIYSFGYPITEEYRDPVSGRIVQYFERARFEWVENLQVVQLGDLGLEVTAGRTYPTTAPIRETAQRRYIPQTQHIIQYGFKEIWETHGAERIFGWPISEEIQEVTSDGQLRTVQYFTKARFEFWPERPAGLRVIISSLGRLLAPSQLVAPVPPPRATPQPQPFTEPASQQQPAPVSPPANENATVMPDRGLVGIDVSFHAVGFKANETVSVWLHRIPMGNEAAVPDVPVAEKLKANDRGQLDKPVTIKTSNLSPGVWRIIAQGWDSKYQAKGHMVLEAIGSTTAPVSQPAQTAAPMNENASVVPDRGPVGMEVSFHAVGFKKNETVSVWLNRIPMGNEAAIPDVPVAQKLKANSQGQLERPITIKTKDLSPGVWRIIAQGWDSKYQAKGHMTLDVVGGTASQPQPVATQPAAQPSGTVVTNVVDGDTIDVSIDGQTRRIRLLGIDTPERDQCYYNEATAKTREWLLGKTVNLEADESQGDTDQYGRLLRYVWLPEGRLINQDLVAEGYAFEYTYNKPYRYQAQFKAAHESARAATKGLWGACGYGRPNCDPAYPDVCIPSPPPDLDCRDISHRNFRVLQPDPHKFDGDGDGIGCESNAPSQPNLPSQPSRPNCDPAYPDVCIPSPPPDLNCRDISHRRFRVLPPDPHKFDGDGDGIGCEN